MYTFFGHPWYLLLFLCFYRLTHSLKDKYFYKYRHSYIYFYFYFYSVFQTFWSGTLTWVLLVRVSITFLSLTVAQKLPTEGTFPATNCSQPLQLSFPPTGLWVAFQKGCRWCSCICTGRAFSSRSGSSLF